MKEGPSGIEWSAAPQYATFLQTERVEILADVAALLVEEGLGLSHRGPVAPLADDAQKLVSFFDDYPAVGHLAHAEVTIARGSQGLFVTQTLHPGARKR